jgi:c-di-GMP-binding flagellar brake protein YcgR
MSVDESSQESPGADLRRESRVRIGEARRITAKYKFLSSINEYQCEDIFEGTVVDLSRGGALLEGVIPDPTWIPGLLDGQIQVGMFIYIPQSDPVKVLGTMRWSRPVEGTLPEENLYAIGLRFEEISDDHKKNLSKFLIGYLLTKKKLGT